MSALLRRCSLGLALLTTAVTAAAATSTPVGRVLSARGSATLKGPGGGSSVELTRGVRVYAGDLIQTGADSSVRLMLNDKSVIDIGANTELSLESFKRAKKVRRDSLRLIVGRVWARVTALFGAGSSFEVDTETAVAGVRGTEFIIEVDRDGKTTVSVIDGSVELASRVSDLAELLGPMMAGSFDGGDRIIVETVDVRRLAKMRADVSPRPQLAASDRQQIQTLLDAAQPAAPERPPLEPEAFTQPLPALEVEPGVGNAPINLQLEIYELEAGGL